MASQSVSKKKTISQIEKLTLESKRLVEVKNRRQPVVAPAKGQSVPGLSVRNSSKNSSSQQQLGVRTLDPINSTLKVEGAPVVRSIAALSIDEGIFLLIAVPVSLEPIIHFARVIPDPIPHLTSNSSRLWQESRSNGSIRIYSSFIACKRTESQQFKVAAVTESGRKILFDVIAYDWVARTALDESIGRFLVFWQVGIRRILPLNHSLVKAVLALAPVKSSVIGDTPTHAIVGSLDKIEQNVALGWVADTQSLGQKFEVDIVSDGYLVGFGIAEHFRADLRSIDPASDGCHHFRIELSPIARNGVKFQARVVGHPSIRFNLDRNIEQEREDSLASQKDEVFRKIVRHWAVHSTDAENSKHLIDIERACCLKETRRAHAGISRFESLSLISGFADICNFCIAEIFLEIGQRAQALKAFEKIDKDCCPEYIQLYIQAVVALIRTDVICRYKESLLKAQENADDNGKFFLRNKINALFESPDGQVLSSAISNKRKTDALVEFLEKNIHKLEAREIYLEMLSIVRSKKAQHSHGDAPDFQIYALQKVIEIIVSY